MTRKSRRKRSRRRRSRRRKSRRRRSRNRKSRRRRSRRRTRNMRGGARPAEEPGTTSASIQVPYDHAGCPSFGPDDVVVEQPGGQKPKFGLHVAPGAAAGAAAAKRREAITAAEAKRRARRAGRLLNNTKRPVSGWPLRGARAVSAAAEYGMVPASAKWTRQRMARGKLMARHRALRLSNEQRIKVALRRHTRADGLVYQRNLD
jgi:hypothetical protein